MKVGEKGLSAFVLIISEGKMIIWTSPVSSLVSSPVSCTRSFR